MKPENWIQIICGGIGLIIIILIFLLTVTFNMKGRIGYFESMPPRINDIAIALRDRGIFLAREEIIKPFDIALITTAPIEASPGNWMSAVHVLDKEKLQHRIFKIKLEGSGDKTLKHRIAGIATLLDETALSFSKLERFSSEIGESVILPMEIDLNASFVLHVPSDEFYKEFEVLKVTPVINSLPSEVDTWDKLIEEITENIAAYIKYKESIK